MAWWSPSNIVKKAYNTVSSGVSKVAGGVKSAVSKATSGIKSAVVKVTGGVANTIKNGLSGVTKKLVDLKDGASWAVGKTVDNVKNFVEEGYVGAALSGAIQGFAAGGFVGAIAGAGVGMVAKKLADGQEVPPDASVDIGSTENATEFNLGSVEGVNDYFKANNMGLTVNENGAVFSDSTGSIVGQYNFSTYTIEAPTEETKEVGYSNIPNNVKKESGVVARAGSAGWKAKYNSITQSYWDISSKKAVNRAVDYAK